MGANCLGNACRDVSKKGARPSLLNLLKNKFFYFVCEKQRENSELKKVLLQICQIYSKVVFTFLLKVVMILSSESYILLILYNVY